MYEHLLTLLLHSASQERVKSYFGKVAEAEGSKAADAPRAKLDNGAAGRFVKAALAAGTKPTGTHTRFDEQGDSDDDDSSSSGSSDSDVVVEVPAAGTKTPAQGSAQKKSDPYAGERWVSLLLGGQGR